MNYIKFFPIFSCLLQFCASYSDSPSDRRILPTGYLEKGDDTYSLSLMSGTEYELEDEDNSKLEIVTDSDDLEQPTRIANYDDSMAYVAIIYEGQQYMVAIPTDDIEDLSHEERTELVADEVNEMKEDVEENVDDYDDAVDMLSYIYTLEEVSNSTDSSIEGEEGSNSTDETVSSEQKSNGESEDSSNSQSFFEYFSRRFLA